MPWLPDKANGPRGVRMLQIWLMHPKGAMPDFTFMAYALGECLDALDMADALTDFIWLIDREGTPTGCQGTLDV